MAVIGMDGSLVKVIDSIHRSVGVCVTKQVAAMLKSTSPYLNFRIESTQLQEGGVDCGLFAIAYTTEFCLGNNPECKK